MLRLADDGYRSRYACVIASLPKRVVVGILFFGIPAFAVRSPAADSPPVSYHGSYELSVETANYHFSYDWSESDHPGWNQAAGFHTERVFSDFCFARILSPKWAIVVRLPNTLFGCTNPIPEILLIELGNAELIRGYKEPELNKPIDGLLLARIFSLSSRPGRQATGAMSGEERQLIRDLDEGKYATLHGSSYERSMWEKSPALSQWLENLNKPALLGRVATRRRPDLPGLKGFNEITAQFKPGGRLATATPIRVLYAFSGGKWSESTDNVAIYRRGQFLRPYQIFSPFPISFKGLDFKLAENSLYFDPETGRLTHVMPGTLESLHSVVFENPMDLL